MLKILALGTEAELAGLAFLATSSPVADSAAQTLFHLVGGEEWQDWALDAATLPSAMSVGGVRLSAVLHHAEEIRAHRISNPFSSSMTSFLLSCWERLFAENLLARL